MTDGITVLLADDDPRYRATVRTMVDATPGMRAQLVIAGYEAGLGEGPGIVGVPRTGG